MDPLACYDRQLQKQKREEQLGGSAADVTKR